MATWQEAITSMNFRVNNAFQEIFQVKHKAFIKVCGLLNSWISKGLLTWRQKIVTLKFKGQENQ